MSSMNLSKIYANIYSSTVASYNAQVLDLHLYIPSYFHLRGKYFTFYSSTLILHVIAVL